MTFGPTGLGDGKLTRSIGKTIQIAGKPRNRPPQKNCPGKRLRTTNCQEEWNSQPQFSWLADFAKKRAPGPRKKNVTVQGAPSPSSHKHGLP